METGNKVINMVGVNYYRGKEHGKLEFGLKEKEGNGLNV